jgi:hypothetical protein
MSVNSVLFSVAEAIPVFGTSIKGALEALYKVLDLVEVSCFGIQQFIDHWMYIIIRRDIRYKKAPKRY